MSDNDFKKFCLRVIKSTYGYDYDPDWHSDLDNPAVYAAANGGFLVTKYDKEGVIVAVGGLRQITTHPIAQRMSSRYRNQRVGALWRVYVSPEHQRQGLGAAVVAQLEAAARNKGYDVLYLHTSQNNPSAVRFWQQRGFAIFEIDNNDDKTTHMEKLL